MGPRRAAPVTGGGVMRILKSRLFIAVVASVTTLLVAGGVAWAVQSPVDANGVMHACYNPTNGNVHLDVVGHCPTTGQKTPITWSTQGPQGVQGIQGPQGPSDAYQTGVFNQSHQLVSFPSGSGYPNL